MNYDRIKAISHKHPLLKAALRPVLSARRSFLNRQSSAQNALLNNLRDMLVGDPIVRVEEFDAVFALDSRSDLFSRLIVHKSYEKQLVDICLKYVDTNRDVVDVGANVGFYAVMFAKHLKQRKVLAIEPTSNAIRRLRQNLNLNSVTDKVDVFEGVASNTAGYVQIKTIAGKEEYSSIGEMKHPSIANEQWTSENVVSATLDDLVRDRNLDPGFLKIDVEGAEHLVFSGAQRFLAEKRPIILTELSDFLLRKNGSSAAAVIASLRANKYDLFDPINPSIPPGAKDFGDLLCFPVEMKVRFGS